MCFALLPTFSFVFRIYEVVKRDKNFLGSVTLKPVGHHFTNLMVGFDLRLAIILLTSVGTTSPRYSRQQDM